MTGKRFLYDLHSSAFRDNGKLININEVIVLLNELHEENTMLKERRHEDINELSVIAMKYKALENENEQLKKIIEDNVDFNTIFSDRDLNDICNEMGYELSENEIKLRRLEKENEHYKKELIEFKKRETHIGDVKREDLDKVFKMSIYEIAETFVYYEKRIKELME